METFLKDNLWFVIFSMLWVLPWKGYALWIAAENKTKWWFILLLVVNTFAILDIIFIFYVAKKTKRDVLAAIKSKIHN